jgi:hypothetical protein
MQKKHDWHKLLSRTGDVEKDFTMVAELLEDKGIFEEIWITEKPIVYSAGNPEIRKQFMK